MKISNEGTKMSQTALEIILEQLPALDESELEHLRQAVQQRLCSDEEEQKRKRFHEALLKSGLVNEINSGPKRAVSERRMFNIQGKPLSETIIEERR
jgi:hypothetical protein